MPVVTSLSQIPPIAKPEFHKPEFHKAIAFQINKHWLALPPAAVLRVIHKATLTQGMGSAQLVYLGNQPMQVLDLRPVLSALSPPSPSPLSPSPLSPSSPSANLPSTAGQFFVIAASGKTLSAIAVDQPPVLVELPVAATHTVPIAYYKAIGGIASHVAVVPQLGTVFLLNLSSI